MALRKYQQEAVDALFKFHQDRPGDSSVIVVPTGGGKTRIMAEIIRRSIRNNPNCRGMIISHVKELLEQSTKTCMEFATEDTGLPLESIGVYSSSIGRREVKQLTIAGIQSVHKKADLFGSLDFILVDEAHLISSNKETMYRRFISAVKIKNSRVTIVGLTATPYRLMSGKIYGEGKTFDDISYVVDLNQLISDGYLCPIHPFGSKEVPNLKKVKVRGGEYLLSDLEKAVEDEALVARGVWDAIRKAKGRNSILVFAITIHHAKMIMDSLKRNGQLKCELITGETPKELREFKINQFKNGDIRWLVNVSVLTTGFDAPNIDCIVVMRPTMSKGLYCQMVGRGLRLSPNKTDCLILDYGSNALRHGDIADINVDENGMDGKPVVDTECVRCGFIYKKAKPVCPNCGMFTPRLMEPKPLPKSLSGEQTNGSVTAASKPQIFDVKASVYSIYMKHPGADPCILETHYLSNENVVKCYHTLKRGMEFNLCKWLKKIGCRDVPNNHWSVNKIMMQTQDWLDRLPQPQRIKCHKNEKGYYIIDAYGFGHTHQNVTDDNNQGHGER